MLLPWTADMLAWSEPVVVVLVMIDVSGDSSPFARRTRNSRWQGCSLLPLLSVDHLGTIQLGLASARHSSLDGFGNGEDLTAHSA
ncbi:hypothetical protein PZA11_006737 [Diplocarpon coronariae]